MATLASPFETDAPRTRFSQWDSRRIAKSAQRFSGALTYDVKGNLVTRPASLPSPALSLVWDFDNKLMGADTNGTPATLEVTYEHDALGRRVARSGPGGNVVYFQAGQQTIADYQRGGVPAGATYRYVFGAYIDEPLLGETVSGSVRHFFHRNQQYSVTSLTDSTGNTAERYAYTACGALTVFNSSGTPQATSPLNNRYTYTGREWDDSTKLYHFRARWYDPVAGRFVGRDPLGFVDGMSLYRGYFAPDSTDPLGLISQTDEKAWWETSEYQSLDSLWRLQGVWDNVFPFSGRLLKTFLLRKNADLEDVGSNENPYDFSEFSSVIQNHPLYITELERHIASLVVNQAHTFSTPGINFETKLNDRVPTAEKAFSVKFLDPQLYMAFVSRDWLRLQEDDLSWALGTGHFGYKNARIKYSHSLEKADVTTWDRTQKCCVDIEFTAEQMIQKDFYSFPFSLARRIFTDYANGRNLEVNYQYRPFWHVEVWTERKRFTCCPYRLGTFQDPSNLSLGVGGNAGTYVVCKSRR